MLGGSATPLAWLTPEPSLTRKKGILSTLDTWATIPGWAERVESIALTRVTRRGVLGVALTLLIELYNGVRLWWLSRHYQAIITDCRLHTSVFGLLERLRLGSQRRHLVFECLWVQPGGRWTRLVKAAQFRAALTPRSRGIVYARRERDAFSTCFGIPAERFVFIPYHTTLTHYVHPPDCPLQPGTYVFAGGDTQRDYHTLCEAVADLDVRVVIAAQDRTFVRDVRMPPNVEVITTDDADFRHRMQHAYVNVVPLEKGTLRSAGQQTFLNAMALGTAVIVTDLEGGGDYIKDGVNGLLVEAGNARQLREALTQLLRDPDLVAHLRTNASQVSACYATERILGLCLDFLISDRFNDGTCSEFLGG